MPSQGMSNAAVGGLYSDPHFGYGNKAQNIPEYQKNQKAADSPREADARLKRENESADGDTTEVGVYKKENSLIRAGESLRALKNVHAQKQLFGEVKSIAYNYLKNGSFENTAGDNIDNTSQELTNEGGGYLKGKNGEAQVGGANAKAAEAYRRRALDKLDEAPLSNFTKNQLQQMIELHAKRLG